MSRQAGFTLVEVLLAGALMAFVTAALLPCFQFQVAVLRRQEDAREEERTMHWALRRLTDDLRRSGFHAGMPPLVLLEGERLAYLISREKGAGEPSPMQRRLITVYRDERSLKYRIQAPDPEHPGGWRRGSTRLLAAGVTRFAVRGIDRRGAATEDPREAVLVEISLRSGGGREADVSVALRNGGS